MRTFVLAAFVLSGCYTDPNGNTCVVIVPGDGSCPSDDHTPSAPVFHRYEAMAAAEHAGKVRIVMVGNEGSVGFAETTTINIDGLPRGEVEPIAVDGEPIEDARRITLAAIGDAAYVAWFSTHGEGNPNRGAPLGPDGSIDPAKIVDLGQGPIQLAPVGDVFLALRTPDYRRVSSALMIQPDGAVAGGPIEILERVIFDDPIQLVGDPGGLGIAGLVAVRGTATGSELVVARVGSDRSLLDGDGVVVATTVAGTSRFSRPSAALMADGTMVVAYAITDEESTVTHVARVPLGGGVESDEIFEYEQPWELVASGDRLLALTIVNGGSTATVLDDHGFAVAQLGTFERARLAAPTTTGFAIVTDDQEVGVALVSRQGSGTGEIVLASDYEVGCCSASGSRSSWLAAVVLGLVLRRRRHAK